jgi:hypothetical protein
VYYSRQRCSNQRTNCDRSLKNNFKPHVVSGASG